MSKYARKKRDKKTKIAKLDHAIESIFHNSDHVERINITTMKDDQYRRYSFTADYQHYKEVIRNKIRKNSFSSFLITYLEVYYNDSMTADERIWVSLAWQKA